MVQSMNDLNQAAGLVINLSSSFMIFVARRRPWPELARPTIVCVPWFHSGLGLDVKICLFIASPLVL
jgi:hypothetical protein